MERFRAELKNEKLGFNCWFYLFVGGAILFVLSRATNELEQGARIMSWAALFLIVAGGLTYRDNTSIYLRGQQLVIEKRLLGKIVFRNYELKKMSQLEFEQNVQSILYTTGSTPSKRSVYLNKDNKEYYFHKEVLSFQYEGKTVEIGKWKSTWGGAELFDMLKKASA